MKSTVFVIATIFLTLGSAAAAPVARDTPFTRDREAAFANASRIYLVPGAKDSGGADNTGMATTIMCTNLTNSTIDVQVIFYHLNGTVAGTPRTIAIASRGTYSVSTKFTAAFGEASAATGVLHGSARVMTTDSAVFCSGFVHDASTAVVHGAALHMVRFKEHPDTQE